MLPGSLILTLPDPCFHGFWCLHSCPYDVLFSNLAPYSPPLTSRDSHTGYLTTSSPLISAATIRSGDATPESQAPTLSIEGVPLLVEPESQDSSPSPKSTLVAAESIPVPSLPGLLDKADTLQPEPPARRGSISRLRGKSPGRKFRDVFSKSKSPKGSPEWLPTDMISEKSSLLRRGSTLVIQENAEAESEEPELPAPAPVKEAPPGPAIATVDINPRPLTPPTAVIEAPVTTITPPTPTTDIRLEYAPGSFQPEKPTFSTLNDNPNIVVSPSGNMISHRRVRSANAIAHQPSKLSNSMTVPFTATIEEVKTTADSRPVSGSFFSSWVSVAQNAASTITNLAGQNRTRSGTNASDPPKQKPTDEAVKDEGEEEDEVEEASRPETPRKQLAVETLGSGDLNFEHLGLEADEKSASHIKPHLKDFRNKDSATQRDEAAARMEDLLAKRAVSAAYEKLSGVTPVAEVPEPTNNNKRHSQTFGGVIGGDITPPNGSIFESESGSIKRTNSVRSRLAKRRSRGSSAATGQSTIGAIIGASAAALANPASGPRLTGFTLAPKQRNRNFHQQFRSVPEDDYLIEDYSCALQREILLAGRIYISEGHICFSSNILGWVTTLVISFEEIVSVERENTALVIPNAIAIQTLHARHTFRSLLSREATYELMIGIWKVSHPANFQKSINGKQLATEEAKEKGTVDAGSANTGSAPGSEGSSDEEPESGEEDGSAASGDVSSATNAGSELLENKAASRKISAMSGAAPSHPASVAAGASGAISSPAVAVSAGVPDVANDFPGPATHVPTECHDSSTHYDKIIKDEVIAAPLGKIYSLLYGPESGVFVRRYLTDDCKSLDLVFEDDKKGLNNENKRRQYTYIKPLGGSIGPKQTKCITTENLDFFDLEKAVTVTCTTQTPDVPSGSAFSTKTRYCLTWAPGNATRFQMNCMIEWTAKSWLKGPIEKGANDGQQQYGDGLVKVLKAAVGGRPRGTTMASKVSKTKKKRKGEKKSRIAQIEEAVKKVEENWGVLEPLRLTLSPIVSPIQPMLKMELVVGFLFVLVMILWFRGSANKTQVGQLVTYRGDVDRLVAYENLWRKEESDFWDWLEARAAVDTLTLKEKSKSGAQRESVAQKRANQLQKKTKGKDMETKVKEEKMSKREMEEAIRITKERLDILQNVVSSKKGETPQP